MLRSALLILSGNAFASLLLLARNLIVARMIPVADYGISSTFALVMSVVEMASALGLQQQIVQAKEGDDPHFQAVLQGFQVLRGVLSGLALFVIAQPMAYAVGVPDADIANVVWAYRLLAVVPVLNALVHFDIHRLNRSMIFWPMLLTGAVPALISVLSLWPLAHWFGDWRVMLYAILTQAVLAAVVSHLVAGRPYRLAFDRAIMARSLRFGWPLLAEAVLLFLVFQGDKLVVGQLLGMAPLAIFSMGMTLTLTPTLVLSKSATNLFLPLLSSAHDGPRFAFLSNVVFELHILFGGCLVFGTALLGPWAVHVVLGAKYAGLSGILIWLAVMQGIRIFKGGTSTVALARGQTENAVVGNIARIAVLPVAWVVVQHSGDLMALLYLGIVGEALGAVVAFWLVWWRLGLGFGRLTPMLLATLAVMGLALIGQIWPGSVGLQSVWPLVGAGVALALAAVLSADLRQFGLRSHHKIEG